MMNRKELPPDDWHSDADFPMELERVIRVERRLKTARPSAVELGPARWERITSASQATTTPEPETLPLPPHLRQSHRKRVRGLLGAVAAAWLVGVAVGAGVMFLMMDRAGGLAHAEHTEKPVVFAQPTVRNAQPETEARPQPPRPSSSIRRDMAEAESPSPAPRVIAPVRVVHSASWLDRPLSKHAGTLRAFERELIDDATVDMQRSSSLPRPDVTGDQVQLSETQRALARSFVPPRRTTRQELWDDLQTSGDVF